VRRFGPEPKNLADSDYLLMGWHDDEFHFEYENSSRGLVHNLVKLAMYAQSKPGPEMVVAIFIRTKNHAKKHHADFKRAKFLAKKLCKELKTFDAIFYDEVDMGSIATIGQMVKILNETQANIRISQGTAYDC